MHLKENSMRESSKKRASKTKKPFTRRLLMFFLVIILAIPLINLLRFATTGGITSAIVKEVWRGGIFPGTQGYVNGYRNKLLCVTLPTQRADDKSKNEHILGKLYFFSTEPSKQTQDAGAKLRQMDALTKIGFFTRSPGEKTIKNELHHGFYYQLTDEGWTETGYGDKENCLIYGEKEFLGATQIRFKDSRRYRFTIREGIPAAAKMSAWAQNPDIQTAFPEIQQALGGIESTLMVSREQFIIASILSLSGIRDILEWAIPVAPTETRGEDLFGEDLLYKHISYLDLPNVADVDSIVSRQEYSVIVFPAPPAELTHPAIKRKAWPYLERLVDIGVLQRTFEPNLPLYPRQKNPSRAEGYVYRLTPLYQHRWSSSAVDGEPLSAGRLYLGQHRSSLISFYTVPDGAELWSSIVHYRKRVTFDDPPRWMKDEALLEQWPELERALHGYACTGIIRYNRITKTFHNEGTYQTCPTVYDLWDM
jgi:hypothetical protein